MRNCFYWTVWSNVESSPELDAGYMIWLLDAQIGEEMQWFVEGVAIDIIVTREPPPVGGEAYPVNKASLLAPWIAVGPVLAGGAGWYFLRRRRAEN